MEQWPLVLGIRMHVYLMQTSSLETCRRDSTRTSQNPPWLLANVPSPIPSATAAGGCGGGMQCASFPHASCTVHMEQQTQKDFIHRLHR